MSELIWYPSPNFNDRPTVGIESLVFHYTGMRSLQDSLGRLSDPAAKVSAHYVVGEAGEIYHMVPDHLRAWHAGVGAWRSFTSLNDVSIGIEIQNRGHEFGYTDFPTVQIEAVTGLALKLIQAYDIKPVNIIGHSDLAPNRKEDPGERFPWQLLAHKGIGVWPEGGDGVLDEVLEYPIEDSWHKLREIGYHIQATNEESEEKMAVLQAFQRRFLPSYFLTPEGVSSIGVMDDMTRARIHAVWRLYQANA